MDMNYKKISLYGGLTIVVGTHLAMVVDLIPMSSMLGFKRDARYRQSDGGGSYHIRGWGLVAVSSFSKDVKSANTPGSATCPNAPNAAYATGRRHKLRRCAQARLCFEHLIQNVETNNPSARKQERRL